MDLLIVGINHHTAPVALREKVAFAPDQLHHALHDLLTHSQLSELAILSTCNRTEIICIAKHQDPVLIIEWLANYHRMPINDLQENIYTRQGEQAMVHLMRVATGLDSMILGEPQILGQVKECFNAAATHKTMGTDLNQLSQTTNRIAKKVRTDTSIGENSVSVASTSVTLAAQLFSDLSSCHALLIGAGDTTELVARHLIKADISRITIANRTLTNAQTLAREIGAEAIDLSAVPGELVNADIVISATASQLPIIGKGVLERTMKLRKHKPVFMVDLAVPRDIEPEVGNIRDVYLYSVDDLQQIISENISGREEAASIAENIINTEVENFQRERRSLAATDTLVKFRQKNDALKQAELAKALQKLKAGDDPEQIINSLANQLTNKIIHTPSIQLKQASKDGRFELLKAVEDLFNLGDVLPEKLAQENLMQDDAHNKEDPAES